MTVPSVTVSHVWHGRLSSVTYVIVVVVVGGVVVVVVVVVIPMVILILSLPDSAVCHCS